MKYTVALSAIVCISSIQCALADCPPPPQEQQGLVSADWWQQYSSWCYGCGGKIISYSDGSKGCGLPAQQQKPQSLKGGLVSGAVSLAITHFFLSKEADAAFEEGERKQSELIEQSQTLLQGDRTPKEKFDANSVMDVNAQSAWEQFKKDVRAHQHDLTAKDPDNKPNSGWCDANSPVTSSQDSVAQWKKTCNGDGFVADANPPATAAAPQDAALQEFASEAAQSSGGNDNPAQKSRTDQSAQK
jgi:hypothetical protein